MQLVSWARKVLFGHAGLALVFVVTGLWPLALLVSLAPFFGTLLNRVLAQGQHFGMAPNAGDFRDCARTIVLHPFLAFLYWQMNYHLEHHMYPAVPFFRLRRLQSLIASDLPKPVCGVRLMLRLMHEMPTGR